jgi:hypothetical protein
MIKYTEKLFKSIKTPNTINPDAPGEVSLSDVSVEGFFTFEDVVGKMLSKKQHDSFSK